MGKPKKKGNKAEAEEFGHSDDSATEQMEKLSTEETLASEPSAKVVSKKDKKKKKNKGLQDNEDLDIEAEVKALSLEANGDMEEDHIAAPERKTKKPPARSAFELLMDNDDSDKSGKDSEDEGELKTSTKEENNLPSVASDSTKSKKEKKKKGKPKKAEEEDIDAILAAIEDKPSEKKKDKKKSKKENTPEDTAIEVEEVEKVEPKIVTIDDLDEEDDEYYSKKKKKAKKGKAGEPEQAVEKANEEEAEVEDGEGEEGTVKTAAQKRKEKRDREKQKKLQEKQKQKKSNKDEAVDENKTVEEASKEGTQEASEEATPDAAAADEDKAEEAKEGKKKKKKKGDKDKEEEKKTAKPNKKLALLKEHLKKVQEEEQRLKEEAERERLAEEERIRALEEQKRLEEEKRLKKKMKKKEREDRLKQEGKFLTVKQKQDKRRLEQMLAAMKEAGADLPNKDEIPKKKPIYTKKKKTTVTSEDEPLKSPTTEEASVAEEEETIPKSPTEESGKSGDVGKEAPAETPVKEEEDVKDAWDLDSEEEEDEEEEEKAQPSTNVEPVVEPAETKKSESKIKEEEEDDDEDEEDDEEEESEEDEDDEEESSEESESESEDDLTPAQKGREKVLKRAEKANKERTLENLRAPVVCVLGHVDTGKTKILDKLRRTNVQDGEAGGITQQIGATNVPREAIQDKTKMCKEFAKQELKLPGLLIIDTPGHESFSNLRVRGTSLCDIAILVIDIMHGLEPQTIESINLLKERKTPFVVALNKIDRLYQWKPQPMTDVQNTLKKQSQHTKSEFDERTQQVIVQLAEEGLNAALFYENKNPKEYISLVPTSAHSGDGMGNLVALICELCQTMLPKRLMYSPNLQAVTMEVKAITGMGTTIDVILINGSINEGDLVVLAGTEGPIVTPIRGLLMPQPMKELRVKNQYEHHKTVLAAQGVKIIAKDLEKALAGLPLYVAHDNDEKEYYKEEVAAVLKDTLESIKVQERGVFVQASTLGSLEALLEFLRTSEIPYAGISIGPVHKKDIMRASVMLEHDSQYAVILAFDVKVEREAQELADTLGVTIFTADIIYHLFDAFIKYRDDLKRKRQEEFKNIAVFPCKLRVLPQFIFNSRDPIVMGVSVEAGFIKEGTPICVPSKEFVELGRVASIEANHKPVPVAKQGQEICIKILPTPGEAPKMYGRHFDETDMLVSKISRQSIDAVKDHFREEMSKQDWRLMVELKKQFEIL
ncbi:eukaryotic translation initiation factor 5B-like [Elysia marginata]|uniref:Eukaryotic translation initiation factor 5B n=1 Tax=Elysia marginata TaxID=1093978 RepID=A0AAV4JTH6_9GAST|nr:eukaryotic translation initiation factor 5B-like [Elysia marginata]